MIRLQSNIRQRESAASMTMTLILGGKRYLRAKPLYLPEKEFISEIDSFDILESLFRVYGLVNDAPEENSSSSMMSLPSPKAGESRDTRTRVSPEPDSEL